MTDLRLKKITDILIEEYHPKRIILFGSRGKDTYTPSSDYDIAIDTNKSDLRQKRIIKERIERVIGLNKIDLVFLREVESGFREIIYKSGKIIYER